MNIKSFSKHICFWFLTYLFALQVVTSRWVVAWLHVPNVVSKVITLALYLPFLFFIVWQFIGNVKSRKFDLFNVLYYSFFLYYCLLSAYRLFVGLEVKDNLYYTVICLGCFALFSLLFDGKMKIDGEALTNDLCYFSLLLIVYWFLFNILLKSQIHYSPINEIAVGGCVTILLPVCIRKLWKCRTNLRGAVFCMVLISGLLLIIFTLGSRAVFVAALGEVFLLLLLCIKNRKIMGKYILSVLLAVAVTVGLFALDVGEVRYCVYRQTGFLSSWEDGSSSANRPDTQLSAQEQIERSDNMRADLANLSVEEIKKNVLFGTGVVFFDYAVAGEVFAAPAHNFIYATMNCYGLIGLLLLIGLVLCTLFKSGAFCFKERKMFHLKAFLLVTLVAYFGIGLIQATVYDMMVMPTMFIALAGYASDIIHKEG